VIPRGKYIGKPLGDPLTREAFPLAFTQPLCNLSG
jgi:hypothetical protein